MWTSGLGAAGEETLVLTGFLPNCSFKDLLKHCIQIMFGTSEKMGDSLRLILEGSIAPPHPSGGSTPLFVEEVAVPSGYLFLPRLHNGKTRITRWTAAGPCARHILQEGLSDSEQVLSLSILSYGISIVFGIFQRHTSYYGLRLATELRTWEGILLAGCVLQASVLMDTVSSTVMWVPGWDWGTPEGP